MSTNQRYFGTDGIRGRVGKAPLTPEFLVKLGMAIGQVLQDTQTPKVVIGKDTRLSGYMVESALEAGLAAAGTEVLLLGPMPTPAVAYLTRTFHAAMGVVISASHNPYWDNGIKFFSRNGTKLPDAIEHKIESLIDTADCSIEAKSFGRARRIDDATARYIEYCKSTLPSFIQFSGLKIVVDCANGATYRVAPAVLEELGAEVIALGAKPDGININHQCGSTHPELLQKMVVAQKADLGIALDGDGDRVILVDHEGTVVDGDEILFILAQAYRYAGHPLEGVVGTQMSNLGLEHALAKENIGFARAKVGDRYVHQLLKTKQWLLGGESSGHIIWLGSSTTGDGIVAALRVVTAMIKQQKSLRELLGDFKKYPQVLINLPLENTLTDQQKQQLEACSIQFSDQLGSSGRALLRPSGTEPLVRVMVEGQDENQVQHWAEELLEQTKLILKI